MTIVRQSALKLLLIELVGLPKAGFLFGQYR